MQDSNSRTETLSPIEITCRLNCPPRIAWAAITEAERIAEWWGDYVSVEARPGGAFPETWRDEAGREVTTAGRIETFDPPHRLSLTWKDMDWTVETAVSFALDPDGNETVLTLTHAGWDGFSDTDGAALRQAHGAGWQYHLGKLAGLFATSPP